jgi:hypothetical protein
LWLDRELRAHAGQLGRHSVALARRQWLWVVLNLISLMLVLMYAPANWDAMNFHMPRAAMWLQQGSLDHFPTHFAPQLDRPPVAEVLMAWSRPLAGTWDSAPILQWASGVILAVAIRACIIRMTGPLSRLEETAVLVAVGLSPMIIAQSTAPQVDLTSLALVGCAAGLTAEFVRNRARLVLPLVGLGFGLAIATKGTALVGLIAVAAAAAPTIIRRSRNGLRSGWTWRRLADRTVLALGALSVAALVVPIAPTMYRNLSTFDTLAGPEQGALIVSTNDPRLVVANSLRQLGPNLQFGQPGDLAIVLSRAEVRALRNVAGVIGGSEAETSDAINHFSADPFAETRPRTNAFPTVTAPEDVVGSPLVYNLALLGLLGTALLWRRLTRRDRRALVAATLAVVAAFLASGKVVKLQYWGNRLTLPVTLAVLVLGLITVIVISRRTRYAAVLLPLIVVAGVWSWLTVDLVGPVRPLISTDDPLFEPVSAHRRWDSSYDRYFYGGLGLGADFARLEDYLDEHECEQFGIGSFIGIEFPLWVVSERTGTKIVHVEGPYGPSSSEDAGRPCVVVRQNEGDVPSDIDMPYGYLAIEVVL